MKFITQALKDRLIQLHIANKLPTNAEDFDDRLLMSALVGISYTVTVTTITPGHIQMEPQTKTYIIFLERLFDAFNHLQDIRTGLHELGMSIELLGNYMFKVSTTKGFILYSIAPTKQQNNILNNQN